MRRKLCWFQMLSYFFHSPASWQERKEWHFKENKIQLRSNLHTPTDVVHFRNWSLRNISGLMSARAPILHLWCAPLMVGVAGTLDLRGCARQRLAEPQRHVYGFSVCISSDSTGDQRWMEMDQAFQNSRFSASSVLPCDKFDLQAPTSNRKLLCSAPSTIKTLTPSAVCKSLKFSLWNLEVTSRTRVSVLLLLGTTKT